MNPKASRCRDNYGDYGNRRPTSYLMLLAVSLFFLFSAHTYVHAGDNGPVSINSVDQKEFSSVLDGLTFEGKIGAMGEPAFSEDTWVFKNGMFASMECKKCGFPKGKYWVRFEDGGVRFRTETVCPLTNAALVYNGIVKGDRIEGTYTWTKDRWYWDIEKEFWFKGTLTGPADLAETASD